MRQQRVRVEPDAMAVPGAAHEPSRQGELPWTDAPPLRRLGPLGAVRRCGRRVLTVAALLGADGFIASYPKAGRTWLRFILANYFSRAAGLGLEVDLRTMFQIIPNDVLDRERGLPAYRYRWRSGVPFLVMSHAVWQPWRFRGKPVALLLRDPRDTLVSFYFHMTRHQRAFAGGLDAFLREPHLGAPALCHYYNGWAAGLARHPHLALSYEQMRAAPEPTVAELLRFFGLDVEGAALAHAAAASELEAMRAAEAPTTVPGHLRNPSDSESGRVRRGKVGGWRDYLGDDEVGYVDMVLHTRLNGAAKAMLANIGHGLP